MSEEKNIPEENSKRELTTNIEDNVNKNIPQTEAVTQPPPEQNSRAGETQNSTPETENMEVHHHPHVEKKNFKEYLLEGLMIFLAVTMGFFAENIREHLSEKDKAYSLATSLENDLEKDTTQLNFLIDFNRSKLSALDSLFGMTLIPYDQVDQQYFYGDIQRAVHTKLFSPNNASAEEIKKAGYFHYYNTDSLAGFISQYDFIKTDFINESALEIKIDQDEWVEIAAGVTDPDILNKTLRPYHPLPIAYKKGINPVPAEKMNQFKGHITKMRMYTEYDIDVFLRMKAKATEIMNCMKRNKIITGTKNE